MCTSVVDIKWNQSLPGTLRTGDAGNRRCLIFFPISTAITVTSTTRRNAANTEGTICPTGFIAVWKKENNNKLPANFICWCREISFISVHVTGKKLLCSLAEETHTVPVQDLSPTCPLIILMTLILFIRIILALFVNAGRLSTIVDMCCQRTVCCDTSQW